MSPERRLAIVRLLETRDMYLPEQRRRDPSPAGFVHQTTWRESCPDCLANGRTLKGCETCRGRGYLEHRRQRDPYATDVVMPYGWSADRHEARRELDAQVGRLEAQTRPPWSSAADELADANSHPYGWEVARRAMYRDFDYGALDCALERLRDVDRGAYHALHEVWIYGWMPVVSAGLEAALQVGLAFLDERLPTPVRAPGLSTTEVAA